MAKPNILFILIDDMGWTDIEPFGSSFYETPNLTQLARDGMLFTDAYAACPVCSPTRASFLTGKYPARVGVTNFIGGANEGKLLDVPYLHYLPLTEKTVAQALKEGGYRTYHVGKWHLGSEPYWPEHHGFDVNIGGCDWGAPRTYFAPYGNPRLVEGPPGEYLTDRLTEEAIQLLRQNGDQPFFMYLAHYAVHIPIQSPPDLVKKYEAKAKARGFEQKSDFEVGERMPTVRWQNLHVRRRLRQSDPKYAAMIENLDANIGRLLDALETLGLKDNTIVIFTSDNGGLSTAEGSPTCNYPLAEGKGWMQEGGVREPCVIRWPAVIHPGTKCEVPITTPDFYPTFLEAAGLPLMPDQHCDGVSLMPLLRGEPALQREAIFWHYPHYSNQGGTPGAAIRMGDYKLIELFEDEHVELYNLRDDIGESQNVAEQQPDRVTAMLQRLKSWQTAVEALIPKQNPGYPHNFSPKYTALTQQFELDAEGVIFARMRFSPDNPELFDIPMADLLEEYIGPMLELFIDDTRYAGILRIDSQGRLVFADTHREQDVFLSDLLGERLNAPLQVLLWQKVDAAFKLLDPPQYVIKILRAHAPKMA